MANIDYASLKKGGFMRQKQKGYFSLSRQLLRLLRNMEKVMFI